jgi:hypothetical protein
MILSAVLRRHHSQKGASVGTGRVSEVVNIICTFLYPDSQLILFSLNIPKDVLSIGNSKIFLSGVPAKL